MSPRLSDWGSPKYYLILIGLLAVYFLAGKLGLSLTFVHASSSPVWPPTGVALAALLLFGYRIWPAIFAGAFLVNITTFGSAVSSLGIALGNTLEGLIGAFLVTRFAGGTFCFHRPGNIIKFAVLAGVVATALGATIGVTSLSLTGFASWPDFSRIWFTWWLGDLGGALIVAPFLILWLTRSSFHSSVVSQIELFLATLFLMLIGLWLSSPQVPFPLKIYPLSFIPLPLLVWIAFRLTPRETAFGTLVLWIVATLGTLRGISPFAGLSVNNSLLLLQVFLAVISLTALLLASAVHERRRIERYFRALVEHSYDVVAQLDIRGSFTWISPSAFRVLGYTPGELIGTSAFDLVHAEDIADARTKLAGLIRFPHRSVSTQYRLRHKNGSWIWVEGTATNLVSDPDVGYIVSNFRDITERIETDRAKTEFLSLAAHQLRTPLSNIKWNAELLGSTSLSSKQQSFLTSLAASAQSMSNLINSLLNLTRIQLGKFQYTPQDTDLSQLGAQTISEFRGACTAKGVTIRGTYPPSPIRVDSQVVQVILQNLLSNAIRHSPNAGRVELKISASKNRLNLSVSDSGPGIPRAQRPHIFQRIPWTAVTASDQQSFGLGLYLTKTLVEKSGGRIGFKSDPGQKTTFSVTLPVEP